MKCAAALSTSRNTDSASQEVLDRVVAGLGGEPADLALIFASAHHADAPRARSRPRSASAASGRHVLRLHRRVDRRRGPGGRGGHGPGALVDPAARGRGQAAPADRRRRRSRAARRAEAAGSRNGPRPGPGPPRRPVHLPDRRFLKRLNAEAAGLRVVGGMASASQAPGQNRLVLDGEVFEDGAVALPARRPAPAPVGRQPGLPADRPADDRHQGRPKRDPASWAAARRWRCSARSSRS